MTANEIRAEFLAFFASKHHSIVPSAPMVLKNDPTLMFTNAGMNQFKDYFLGNEKPKSLRVADSQKCLRVSGKHNDLEEVGIDTYHHTMFEMLGNWSFGDYFKNEAIEWAWELLTEVFKLDKDRLYVTYFGGDDKENMAPDSEARELWKSRIAEDRILPGSKKDNFWEMGDTGPCGPCSEIHVDLRDAEERKAINGASLVNNDHPQVIEIWNLVFIQFNRNAAGKLEQLPDKHVDTGMGFERLVRAIQLKKSNYDTDVFTPLLSEIGRISGKPYGKDEKTDIAFRVIADHMRAVAFAIADGQLPSNVKAGYVIRRILRRAVRYGYSFLEMKEPFICKVLPVLVKQMGEQFPELKKQQDLIEKVIHEEEASFLRALENGIGLFENYVKTHTEIKVIDGKFAFELYDTYGFPIDLTQLLAREINLSVDLDAFHANLNEQKNRSRQDAAVTTGDWVELIPASQTVFTGYEKLKDTVKIARYRMVNQKGKDLIQLVFDRTPFYAESGGQVGDTGSITAGNEVIQIVNTMKELNLSVHLAEVMPSDPSATFIAEVDEQSRLATMRNHSATHLMHEALREVLGTHVEQKGSLVNPESLRFDFSHFQKLSDEEILKVERLVNERIRQNILLDEQRDIDQAKAIEMGAMALFGEKYGDKVRVIRFGGSIELCGGTHIPTTGMIGLFKITSESAIAAGVRRIEAVSGNVAEELMHEMDAQIKGLKQFFKGKDPVLSVQHLLDNQAKMQKELDVLKKEKLIALAPALLAEAIDVNGVLFLGKIMDVPADDIKEIAFGLRGLSDNLVALLASTQGEKASISLLVSDKLVKDKGWNAGKMIRDIAKAIEGGGGGQPFLASAGGTKKEGIGEAIELAKAMLCK